MTDTRRHLSFVQKVALGTELGEATRAVVRPILDRECARGTCASCAQKALTSALVELATAFAAPFMTDDDERAFVELFTASLRAQRADYAQRHPAKAFADMRVTGSVS